MRLGSASFLGFILTLQLAGTAANPAKEDDFILDFRYAPTNWQTSICLPDDWQKTLVGRDGALLYDYPGKFAGFGTRLIFSLAEETRWLKQELVGPRVPIVRTFKQYEQVELVEETFALPPNLAPSKTRRAASIRAERLGGQEVLRDWAAPPPNTDPAFRHVAVGWKEPVHYRFKSRKGEHYTVVFGLCEGWHEKPGSRILDLSVEGGNSRTVDPVAEQGRNQPCLYILEGMDADGDGWVDLRVAANSKSPDQNTIANIFWVFRGKTQPSLADLKSGRDAGAWLRIACGETLPGERQPRHDIMLVRMRNTGSKPTAVSPMLILETASPVTPLNEQKQVAIGGRTLLTLPESLMRVETRSNKTTLAFHARRIAPGEIITLAFAVTRGSISPAMAPLPSRAAYYRQEAEKYWQKLNLPYGAIEVPDPAVQALLDSSIRNIYQAREIKKGLPAFQVGPTCYRGLWVVDGSFIMEAVAYLGRAMEARNGIKYLLSFQRPDGAFMLIDGHWKETGIVLWAVTRHARLTGDKKWLREVWPNLERGFDFIRKMRQMPPAGSPNAGLIPDGFSDGGLADKVPEYTNIYWTLAGMRAAVRAARWLGLDETAAEWQREYEDFYQTFRKAAERDQRTDAHGHQYLPIRMAKGEGILPQKAQWAFCHAVFPGQVFRVDDPLVQGNMAMLKAVESEGLVLDTGWLGKGIWNYFGSFYAHAWLWLGYGEKAAQTLYAFGNHASPLLVWREEQMPVGQGAAVVGDMPHNWASAEFIRLIRHLIVLERGSELHLFEGLPRTWLKPGATIRLKEIATEFGPVSLELEVDKYGATARLRLEAPRREPPQRIVAHLEGWAEPGGTISLPIRGTIKHDFVLKK